jgi:hypothetical protein
MGLPRVKVTSGFLRAALRTCSLRMCRPARYHDAKARRLAKVHHRLDRLAESLFSSRCLGDDLPAAQGRRGAASGPAGMGDATVGVFTFLASPCRRPPPPSPACDSSAISSGSPRSRKSRRKSSSRSNAYRPSAGRAGSAIDYAGVSRLAHEIDDVVVAEIESWQAVFSGKHIALPA